MKATQKMMDFFQQAEQMLTEERPFNKDRWQDMIKYLRTTHLANDFTDIKGDSFNKQQKISLTDDLGYERRR